MLIGAHVREDDPLAGAQATGSQIVQLFLGDPQSWKKPAPHPSAQQLLDSDLTVVVHSPYPVNLASVNNRIRMPSRSIVAQHAQGAAEMGAIGLVVHGGHVTKADDPAEGVENWRKFFARAEHTGGFPVPILIENTAGGDHAMARHFDALARLWDAVAAYGVGFCLDTCHAWAGGNDLSTMVDRILAITGRIDFVHANDSRDTFDSGADRHTNFGSGEIDGSEVSDLVRAAGCPVVVETPGGVEGQSADITWLRDHVGG